MGIVVFCVMSQFLLVQLEAMKIITTNPQAFSWHMMAWRVLFLISTQPKRIRMVLGMDGDGMWQDNMGL